jgi:hypothetical protein
MYRIEHIDNITTGICESCDEYGILTLERFKGEDIYVCNLCLDWLEKDIYGTVDPLGYVRKKYG